MGLTSIRQQLLQQPWASAEKKIKSLEIFFSNTCNLGCFMCSSDVSSYAAEERYQTKIIPTRSSMIDNVQLALDTINLLPDLQNITFIGGEFFLHKRNSEILDVIIQKNFKCDVVTNASVITPPLLEKLQQVKNLDVGISVDGTDDVYNFMRYPADWHKLNHNIDVLKNTLTHAHFYVNTVFQPLNVQNLHELYQWANKKILPVHHQMLVIPEYLTWKILTTDEKNSIIQLLQAKQKSTYKLTSKQKTIIDELVLGIVQDQFDPFLRQKGIEYLSKLLVHRKISKQEIKKQFNILNNLAKEIIATMHIQ
jgi:MoaA/NifB/PqqE/SkfB family radical SAM enzyme